MQNKLTQLFKRRVNTQLVDDLLQKTQNEVEKMPPLNILVAGKTGSGKSTLINALFREKMATTGEGLPITQQLVRLTKSGVPLTLYDTKGLELTAQSQREVLNSLSDLIIEKRQGDPKDKLHVVYYCLNASAARIETFEIELVQTLAKHLPVVLVLTQTLNIDNPDSQAFIKELKRLNLPVKAIVPILAKPYILSQQTVVEPYGLERLIELTLQLVPEETHRAFINAQQIDLDLKVKQARSWAHTYVSTAFGVGFVPIPVADATLLIPMQITMLAHLSAIFGVSLDKAQLVSLVMGLGGTSGTTMVGKLLVSSAFKLFPGLGTVSGGVVTGAIASALTLGLGYSYIEVLKQLAVSERSGRDMTLKEIQRLMNRSFEQHIAVMQNSLPEGIRDHFIPTWIENFLKKF